jgi:hypothetical protein
VNLSHYVDELQQELLVAADAGGDDVRQVAERLVAPLQSATRLVLLDALSAAAAEITSELAPGSVEVRLRNRDPEFVVTTVVDPATSEALPSEPPPADAVTSVTEADDGATSRVTLRLPEVLKLRIDEAAGRSGLSVNAWLVRTLTATVDPAPHQAPAPRGDPRGGQRFTGWAHS